MSFLWDPAFLINLGVFVRGIAFCLTYTQILRTPSFFFLFGEFSWLRNSGYCVFMGWFWIDGRDEESALCVFLSSRALLRCCVVDCVSITSWPYTCFDGDFCRSFQ